MPESQLHRRLSDELVRSILEKYHSGELTARQARTHLEIGNSRFFELAARFSEDPQGFTIAYPRHTPNRRIRPDVKENIIKELKFEKEKIIDNPDVPTTRYNYSYIKERLKTKYKQSASVGTIISLGKEYNCWKPKPPKKIHDREVITNYAGELIQHDSSFHLWAPDSGTKWYLVTSIDDYSRAILYADFFLKETTWAHISAVQSLVLTYGIPLQYYVDQLRVFRYVKDRDKNSPWNTFTKFTDDVDPQWKQMMNDCGIKVTYALSPQAKGKVERPYEWLQDHIVRTCVREGVTKIEDARVVLKQEVNAYNWKRIHSTTGEVPLIRFRNSIREKKTLFRDFRVTPPFQCTKDIFCLRATRRVDAYRNISLQGFEMKVPGVLPKEEVELRLIPDLKAGIVEVRFWWRGRCTGFQRVKIDDLPIVQF